MKTPAPNLAQQPPASPRERLAGFAVARRTIDKCRADAAGTRGDYHYDCPLDNQLFSFKGIEGDLFREAVRRAETVEDVGVWLLSNGTPRTQAEIAAWSARMEAQRPYDDPQMRDWFVKSCQPLGLDPQRATLFDMLEADDRASFAKPSGAGPATKDRQGRVELIFNS